MFIPPLHNLCVFLTEYSLTEWPWLIRVIRVIEQNTDFMPQKKELPYCSTEMRIAIWE